MNQLSTVIVKGFLNEYKRYLVYSDGSIYDTEKKCFVKKTETLY